MATNTDRKALYKEYGVLKFSLKGKDFELTVYKSQDELEDKKYIKMIYIWLLPIILLEMNHMELGAIWT